MQFSTKEIVISLFLAAATIIAPIIYEEYSHISGLEFRIESANSLIPADPLLSDFLITYQGKPIKSLTRMDCTFLNSGNTPIIPDDTIDEPTIRIPKDSGIIAVILLNKYPQNLYAEFPINISQNEIKLKFSLLNPGDYIKLAIYLNRSSNELPTIAARIKGIREINIVNNMQKDIQENEKSGDIYVFIITIMKYIGIILILITIIFGGNEALEFHRAKNLLKRDPNLLNRFNEYNQFKCFIEKNLAALGSDQKKKLLDTEIIDAERDFSEENKLKLISAIKNALNVRSDAESLLIFAVLLSIVVVAYYYWPIL
jgi:hypothetical protein